MAAIREKLASLVPSYKEGNDTYNVIVSTHRHNSGTYVCGIGFVTGPRPGFYGVLVVEETILILTRAPYFRAEEHLVSIKSWWE